MKWRAFHFVQLSTTLTARGRPARWKNVEPLKRPDRERDKARQRGDPE
jgi:hypothetical protein